MTDQERAERARETIRDFHRRNPAYNHDRFESDYDDDLSDIQPFERTTSYPWGR